jgi:hypothetical protein
MARDDDDDDTDLDPNEVDYDQFDDKVAQRAIAFDKLARTAAEVKDRGHSELYDETMRMLQALRRSFKTLPTGEVHQIK